MDRLVLRPAGMTHSTYRQPLPHEFEGVAATAYEFDGQPFPGRFHVYPELSPDGLWTTPTDLALFAIEIQNENDGRSSTILSPATAREMLTPVRNGFALGFKVGSAGSKPWFGHDGSNFGYFTELFAFAEAGGQGVVVMTNGNTIALKDEFLRAVAKEYGWSAFEPMERSVIGNVPPGVLASYVGRYDSPEIGEIRISDIRDTLVVDAPGMRIGSEKMFPESITRFFIQPSHSEFVFERDPSGKVRSLVIQQMGGSLEAKRTG
jgi:CubicO group peptidase (beta-lactamase class C family)